MSLFLIKMLHSIDNNALSLIVSDKGFIQALNDLSLIVKIRSWIDFLNPIFIFFNKHKNKICALINLKNLP